MKKFEYKIITVMPNVILKANRKKETGKEYLLSEAQKTLDEAGKEGWELTGVHGDSLLAYLYLKRELG